MLRGIAALVVVLHHLGLFMKDVGINLYTFDLGAIGVDIFFVISGFIMIYITNNHNGSTKSTWIFLKKRLFRIMPLYWLITLVYLASDNLTKPDNINDEIIVKSFALIPSYYLMEGMISPILIQGWTLYYEMFFYISLGVLLFVFKPFRAWILISVVFIALMYLGHSIHAKTAITSTYTSMLLLEFLLGGLIARIYLSGWRPPIYIAVSLLTLFGVALTFAPSEWDRSFRWGVPAALLLAGSVFLEAKTQKLWIWQSKIGGAGGEISYSLYLTHYAVFVFASVPTILLWAKTGSVYTKIGYGVYVVFISMLASLILYRYIERPILNRYCR